MYTSIAMLALSSLLGALPQAPGPVWQSDYSRAYTQGKSQKKPLAVFIGSGKHGYDTIAEDGRLTEKMREVLTEKYVCVYVDTAKESGRELARSFRLDNGLVLSDRTGDMQAFRLSGSLSDRDLTGYLEKFGDPAFVFQSTTTHGISRTSNYPSDGAIIQGGFGRSTGSC